MHNNTCPDCGKIRVSSNSYKGSPEFYCQCPTPLPKTCGHCGRVFYPDYGVNLNSVIYCHCTRVVMVKQKGEEKV